MDCRPGAERIADDPAYTLYAASSARLQRSIVAVKANLDCIAPPVKSGIHGFVDQSSTDSADMQAGVTVEGVFQISCLVPWTRPAAVLTNDLIRTGAFQPAR